MRQNYTELSKKIRILTLELAHHAKTSHTGGALSMVDILTVIYGGDIINISPQNINMLQRDRFILSKGHCCAALYSTLALTGFINPEELRNTYGDNGSVYYTHCSHKVPGVEISTGSLGHGLPVAIGQAVASKTTNTGFDVLCLTGDGELDEGSNWEAILFAGHILDIEPLADKFRDFHWNVLEIDGHNFDAIENALKAFKTENNKPTVIIANTIKGKGVSFMEGQLKWHYRNPNDEELKIAKEELQ